MKPLVVRPAAAVDLESAFRWYEQQRPGLGGEFLSVVRETFSSIQDHPDAWPILYRETRRALPRRFPFGIFYRVLEESVVVVACMHIRRHPRSWKYRA